MKEVTSWWETLDINNSYLIKLYSGLFGTSEQRVLQLYIIRDNLNFAKKK